MEQEQKKPTSFFVVLARQISISLAVFLTLSPACIFLLYMWAKPLGTCIDRPSFTLLSMLESALPWIMRPIQNLACPH